MGIRKDKNLRMLGLESLKCRLMAGLRVGTLAW